MMQKETRSKIFYLVLSLFFAFLLFFNANSSTNESGTDQYISKTNNTYTAVVTNIPVKLNYDRQKYFVSITPKKINVTLSSHNKVALDAEVSKQTRKFYAMVNLKQYEPGTYTVPIKLKGLNHSIDSQLSQTEAEVTIEEKAKKTMTVTSNVTSKSIEDGMELSHIDIHPKKVTVSASKNDLKHIDRIVAKLPLNSKEKMDKSFSVKAPLIAYDKQGEELVAEFSKPEVEVTVDIEAPTKKVGLNLIQKGQEAKTVSSFQLLCDTQYIYIQGSKELLNNVSSVDVPIDISHITKTTTRQINLHLPEGIKSKTTSITVTVVPQLSR